MFDYHYRHVLLARVHVQLSSTNLLAVIRSFPSQKNNLVILYNLIPVSYRSCVIMLLSSVQVVLLLAGLVFSQLSPSPPAFVSTSELEKIHQANIRASRVGSSTSDYAAPSPTSTTSTNSVTTASSGLSGTAPSHLMHTFPI